MQKTNYITDDSGRPIKTVYPDGRTISYIYDGAGNLSKIIDSATGSIAYQYDLIDRLIKVIYPDRKILSYAYDPAGNRIRTTYPNGEAIYYRYNKNNLLTEVNIGSKNTRFEYDKAGRLVKKILPNRINVSYAYNSVGRLISLIITDSNSSILFDLSYKLDAVGNYLEIDKKSGTSNGPTNKKTQFTYDPIYRLTKVKYPDGDKVKYKYDGLGNRLSVKGPSTNNNKGFPKYLVNALSSLGVIWNKVNYSYDSENSLIKAGDTGFKYNDNGSLVEKKIGNEITRYKYDYEKRLFKIEHPDGSYSQYSYDALGRRINKRYPNGKAVCYIYDGNNLIQEINDKGQVVASYIYGLRIDQPISMIRSGKIYYYLYDHIGSVIALTDESGKVVVECEYDAWGNITKEVGDIPNPFRFTGREWEEESGLYYYRARYYDPSVGRFISRDPVASSPLNPQTQNKYVYVNNNPYTYVDPFGLMPSPLEATLDSLSNVLIQGLDIFGSTFSPLTSTLGHVANITKFLPSILSSNPAVIASGIHTGVSTIGGIIGGSLGTSAAIGAGLSLGLSGVGGVTIGAATVFLPAVGLIAGGALVGGAIGYAAFRPLGRFATNTIAGGNPLGRFINNTIATGGQNILNAVQSNVGGVLFDKAAEVLTDLEEITGAYWDDKLGQIVLVGKQNGKMEERYLPKMDKDHLAVAMRAVFSGDNLGVSIDPPPSYLESGEFPPDGTKMLTRYLGNTKDTLFGTITLEADRLLKNLSMGIDNETREEVTSTVSDFENELDLSLKYGSERKSAWHRMWFVIEDMKLDMRVKETSDRKALSFGKATLKVKAEYLSKKKNPGVGPIAECFARHFTLNFDEFAKEFPVLERLRELAKISAIAKWLRNSGKPIDLSFLNDHEFIKVPTPEDTPGITASKSKSWQDGNVTHTQTYSLYGGVDFDFKYEAVKDDGEALVLKKTAQGSKPCETTLAWNFKSKGKPQRALAFPLAKTNGNYIEVHIDFALPDTENMKLELARCYDSFNTKPSIFGYGWNLKIPYEIFIINKQKSGSPVLLINKVTGKSYKYMFIEDKQSYFFVNKEQEEGGKTSFTYDPQESIKRKANDSFIYKSKDGVTYNFDSQGRLIFVVGQNNRKLVYTYEGNLIVRISDSLGRNISLIYDNKSRVKQAICPGQQIIDYKYDQSGNLIRVSNNQGYIRNYIYDAYHRLTKSTDARGKVIFRNSYDPLGRIIKKRQDSIIDMSGHLINRTYDNNYRLIKEEDEAGNTTTYKYDNNNNLFKAVLSDKQKRPIVFEYDKIERIKRIENPLNHSIEFNYDSSNNITSFINANNNISHFKYDQNGNPVIIKDAMGNQWKQKFDHLSRLTGIVDPLGHMVEFIYLDNDNRLESIKTPEGIINCQYYRKGRLSKLTDPNGNSTEFIHDSKGNLIEVKDALGNDYVLSI